MADVNFFDDFERVWGTNGDVEAIDQNQYDQGWAFIGATPPSVEQFNKVQQVSDQKAAWLFAQIKELAERTGVDLAPSTVDALTRGVDDSINAKSPMYGWRGLRGNNNTSTPNTKYDVSADVVSLWNRTTGGVKTIASPATLTCDVTVFGTNGRDQPAPFAPSTWVHFYSVWNGATLAAVASTVAPPTGPTLPAGYTHWAYIGALYFNASSQLAQVRILGGRAYYATMPNVITNGGAVAETQASVANSVPPNASAMMINAGGQMNTNGLGGAQSFIALRTDPGVAGLYTPISTPVSGAIGLGSSFWEMPNVAQRIYYFWGPETNPANIALRQANVAIVGYVMPNGG